MIFFLDKIISLLPGFHGYYVHCTLYNIHNNVYINIMYYILFLMFGGKKVCMFSKSIDYNNMILDFLYTQLQIFMEICLI